MNIKIKDIPVNDRPRERLINIGVENLSNEELLSIVLKTGTKNYSVKMLSNNILKDIKDIRNLKDISFQKLCNIKGIGIAKACTIMALIELSKRMNKDVDTINNIKVNSTDVLYKYYKDKIGDKAQEYFYCIYLQN